MPTITVRLSQQNFEEIGHEHRYFLAQDLRANLSSNVSDFAFEEVTVYWYPYADAQNAQDFEIEVVAHGDKDTLRASKDRLFGILRRSVYLSEGWRIGIGFPRELEIQYRVGVVKHLGAVL